MTQSVMPPPPRINPAHSSAASALDAATAHHRAGRLSEAERLYQNLLASQPDHVDALHRLGVLRHQQGRLAEASELVSRAAELQPNRPDILAALAAIQKDLGDLDAAVRTVLKAAAQGRGDMAVQNRMGMTLVGWSRAADAAVCFQRAVELAPDEPALHNSLGNALRASGDQEQAAENYRRAIALDAKQAAFHNNLGNCLQALEKHEEASDSYRTAIALQPGVADCHYNLGNTLRALGNSKEAVDSYERALELNPAHEQALAQLAELLQSEGRAEGGANYYLRQYEQALAKSPNDAGLHNNLGNSLQSLGRHEEAIAAYRRAAGIDPRQPSYQYNLANSLRVSGCEAEANELYELVLALRPDHVHALYYLGSSLDSLGRGDEALKLYEKAIAARPDEPALYNNLSSLLCARGRYDEALVACDQSVALRPDYDRALFNRAYTLNALGRHAESIAAYHHAMRTAPDFAPGHSDFLFVLHYQPRYEAQTIFAEHKNWAARRAASPPPPASIADPNPDRPLHVGYVSSDLRSHSVGYFIEPVLAGHDRSRFQVTCYADVARADVVTQKLRSLCDEWRDIVGLTNERVLQMVREDCVDILVDLAGHTGGGQRLPVFAARAAPVQVTYLGYPDTTALPAMDYRITDSYADPPGAADALSTERLIRLDPCAWCYQPPTGYPDVAPPPAQGSDRVTFGSFNAHPKINPPLVALWAKVLHAVPRSRLLLKNNTLGQREVQERLRELFRAHGISTDRLEFRGREPHVAAHLQVYGQVDVALDTFPYHGTTTTCEALWTGVPVVTLAGQTHVSRVGVSLLSNAGLAELVAGDEGQYVRTASELAGDLPRLLNLRHGMRERLSRSPLLDREGFPRRLEAAYRKMWQERCAAGAGGAEARTGDGQGIA